MTKSDDGNAQPNYFERASAKVNWDEADAYSSGKASVVDAPSSSTNDYIALMHDGNGYFFSKCFHDIRVLQSKEDGSSTAYNHFLMPFRKDAKTALAETPIDFDGPMMQEFSGLEIYSTIDGEVAAVNRYAQGVIYDSAFVGYGSYGDEWISYYLKYYIRKLYISRHCHHENETKAATRVFSCPKCGATLYDSAVGYLCFDCAWSEFESMNDELDPCYIIASPSTPSGGSGRRGMDLTDPDLLNDNGSIDPFAGGGGGGSPQDNNPRVPDEVRKQALEKYKLFHTSPKEDAFILDTFIDLYNDCSGKIIIDAVSKLNVEFIEVKYQYDPALTIPHRRGDKLDSLTIKFFSLNPKILHMILYEELFHCLQRATGRYKENVNELNMEIEAKLAAALYLKKHGFENEAGDTYMDIFKGYSENSSDDNYQNLIDYLRNKLKLSEERYREDSRFRNMDLLNSIQSDCIRQNPTSMK